MTSTPHHHQRNRTTQDRSVRPFGAAIIVRGNSSHPGMVENARTLTPGGSSRFAGTRCDTDRHLIPTDSTRSKRNGSSLPAVQLGARIAAALPYPRYRISDIGLNECRVIARGSQSMSVKAKSFQDRAKPLHTEMSFPESRSNDPEHGKGWIVNVQQGIGEIRDV